MAENPPEPRLPRGHSPREQTGGGRAEEITRRLAAEEDADPDKTIILGPAWPGPAAAAADDATITVYGGPPLYPPDGLGQRPPAPVYGGPPVVPTRWNDTTTPPPPPPAPVYGAPPLPHDDSPWRSPARRVSWWRRLLGRR